MFINESPLTDFTQHSDFDNFFNWTSTYRWDSDFPSPYGWIEPNSDSNGKPPTKGNPPNLEYMQGNGKLTLFTRPTAINEV